MMTAIQTMTTRRLEQEYRPAGLRQPQSAAMRHEQKHLIRPEEALVLAGRLGKLFKRDSHAGEDGSYRVTSLYFDTPYDSALREKIGGVNRREKFRLRYYGEDTSFIRLEKKFKDQGLCGKRSARLAKEHAEELLGGNDAFLLEEENPLCAEFYSKLRGKGLRPRTVVSYDREAFVYEPGNVRITLDRNVRTGLGRVDFLDTNLLRLPALGQLAVLEVKYDEFLPDLVRMAVQIPGRQASACSKYAVCRRYD